MPEIEGSEESQDEVNDDQLRQEKAKSLEIIDSILKERQKEKEEDEGKSVKTRKGVSEDEAHDCSTDVDVQSGCIEESVKCDHHEKVKKQVVDTDSDLSHEQKIRTKKRKRDDIANQDQANVDNDCSNDQVSSSKKKKRGDVADQASSRSEQSTETDLALCEDGAPREDSQEQAEGKAKYYSVRTDLKELFGATDRSVSFSFLEDEVSALQENYELGDEQVDEELFSHVETEFSQKPQGDGMKLFFFHSNSATLRNRLEENSFARCKSLTELEAAWPAKRTAMKHSFRKRQKESMKAGKRKYRALPNAEEVFK